MTYATVSSIPKLVNSRVETAVSKINKFLLNNPTTKTKRIHLESKGAKEDGADKDRVTAEESVVDDS